MIKSVKPVTVSVAGVPVRIEWAELPGDFGETETEERWLRLATRLQSRNDDLMLRTLAHELMHNALYQMGWGDWFDEKTEEAICAVAEVMAMALLEAKQRMGV